MFHANKPSPGRLSLCCRSPNFCIRGGRRIYGIILVTASIILFETIHRIHPFENIIFENIIRVKNNGVKSESSLDSFLRIDNIKRWCLNGDDTSCDCLNPLQPSDRESADLWFYAHLQNIKIAQNAPDKVDVVFLGDSLTEGWKGKIHGVDYDRLRDIDPIFSSLFRKSNGGEFEGLVLAISGDKSPNLLWRIQNGEMPTNLHPKVWWITIGTNDFNHNIRLQRTCSDQVVFMGILRVVQELKRRRPNAIIVINGIFPRTDDHVKGKVRDGSIGKTSIFEGIDNLNSELHKYCTDMEGIFFFDPTSTFVEEDLNLGVGEESKYIPKDLMADDYTHLSVEGYRLWGVQIVKTLRTLIGSS